MTKISELTNITTLADADEFVVNDAGVTKAIAYSALRDLIRGGGTDNSVANLGLGEAKFNMFRLQLTNTGSQIEHKIINPAGEGASNHVDGVNGASTTNAATPNGTDSSTAFASGAKISSAAANQVYLDTADLSPSTDNSVFVATIATNYTSTTLYVSTAAASLNINGTTRTRLRLSFVQSDSSAFNINTTNITSGEIISIDIFGFMPDYA